MELRQYARLIREYWILLLLATALGGETGFFLTVAQPAQYQTSTILGVVGTKETADPDQAYLSQLFAQGSVATYAELASSRVVLQDAADAIGEGLDVATLSRGLTVEVPTGTSLVELTVRDESPERAQQIATEVGRSLTKAAAELEPVSAGAPTRPLVVVQPAELPNEPVSDGLVLNTLIGVMLGLLIGLGVASLHLYFRGTVRDSDDVYRMLPAPVLSSVRLPGDASAPLAHSGDLRALALLVLEEQERRKGPVVLIGATNAADTSQLTARLAEAIADSGTSVLLISDGVDDDGWKGRQLDGLLATGETPRLDRLDPSDGRCLFWLRSGWSDASTPLVAGARQRATLDLLNQSFDIVIVDAPALSGSLDGAVIGAAGSTNLLVVDTRRTRRRDLTRAFWAMSTASGEFHGIVLTRRERT